MAGMPVASGFIDSDKRVSGCEYTVVASFEYIYARSGSERRIFVRFVRRDTPLWLSPGGIILEERPAERGFRFNSLSPRLAAPARIIPEIRRDLVTLLSLVCSPLKTKRKIEKKKKEMIYTHYLRHWLFWRSPADPCTAFSMQIRARWLRSKLNPNYHPPDNPKFVSPWIKGQK